MSLDLNLTDKAQLNITLGETSITTLLSFITGINKISSKYTTQQLYLETNDRLVNLILNSVKTYFHGRTKKIAPSIIGCYE
jgi:hypothetical protein